MTCHISCTYTILNFFIIYPNKNWVTVRDKCPQINVKLNGIPFKENFVLNGRTNERTDGQSDFIMPQILFGGIKITHFTNNENKNVVDYSINSKNVVHVYLLILKACLRILLKYLIL